MRIGLLSLAASAFLLAGCGGGQYVGTGMCAKDGSAVWYVQPNSMGIIDTAIVNPENCIHKKK